MLTMAVSEGHIHGVSFPELDYQIAHGIYADDIHLIVEDRPNDLAYCFDLFDRFGEASGLMCELQKTHAVFLSHGEIPQRLLDYGWIWEDKFSASKLLGIHIAEEIVLGLMTKQLRIKLERGLQRLRLNPASLIGRATTINNLILSSLWFTIVLCGLRLIMN